MKSHSFTSLALAAVLSTGALTAAAIAQETGPAEKKDSGSLQSGQKQSMPSTRDQGENAPVGSRGAASGTSSGEAGAAGEEQLPRKGTGGSDPARDRDAR